MPLLSCPPQKQPTENSSEGASCLASAPGMQSPSCAGAIFKPAQMSSCCRKIFYHPDLCTLNPIQFQLPSNQGQPPPAPSKVCSATFHTMRALFPLPGNLAPSHLATCQTSFKTRQNVRDWRACLPAHILPTQAPCSGASRLHLHG